jgi:hypothetical protein
VWRHERAQRKFCQSHILLMPDKFNGYRETPAVSRHLNRQKRSWNVSLTTTQTLLSWALRLTSAAILLQTLFFKFTGSAESVYIFTRVGAEPWGRLGSGVVELIAAILLLVPSTTALGALLALGLMAGAIASHLTVLGVEVMGDGGLLFGLAIIVFLASLVVLSLHRSQIPFVGHWFADRPMAMSPGGRR